MAKYRRVYPRLWDSVDFGTLTTDQKLLCLNILTGPQSNRVGCFVYRLSMASEETGIEVTHSLVDSLCDKLSWVYDKTTRVLWIPSWFAWNPPESRDALMGYVSDLAELPKSETVDRLYHSLLDSLSEYDKYRAELAGRHEARDKFSKIWAGLYDKLRQTVPQPVAQPVAQSVLHQEHKQEHEQDHEHDKNSIANISGKPKRSPVAKFDPVLHANVPEWLTEHWAMWCEHRRELKKPITKSQSEALIKKLCDMGPQRAVNAIIYSTGNGYQGLFEEARSRASNGPKTMGDFLDGVDAQIDRLGLQNG